VPAVTPSMVERAKGSSPDATLQQLGHGRDLFTSKCGHCHNLPDPKEQTAEQWRPIMDEMADKAKLSADEKAAVLAFVLAARDGS
jgi:hypothetical protein